MWEEFKKNENVRFVTKVYQKPFSLALTKLLVEVTLGVVPAKGANTQAAAGRRRPSQAATGRQFEVSVLCLFVC